MELAKTCYFCEYYILAKQNGVGICDRAGDAGACFAVRADEKKCLYSLPGYALSREKIEQRDKKSAEGIKRFDESLERASEMVASWPEWKRRMADQIFAPRPSS